MSAQAPDARTPTAPGATYGPAYQLTPAAGATPLIFASPHSGRIYPDALMAASRLDATAIRASEDAFVDELIAPAAALGVNILQARLARAYVDLNRAPDDLDPNLMEAAQSPAGRTSARAAAGLGVIPRVVGQGREIYAGRLSLEEMRRRLDTTHQPYHAALAALVAQARQDHGVAVLIDWHSMPSAASALSARGGCDIVLGDRHGASCAAQLTRTVERSLTSMGYNVGRNSPYAGGYTTEHYGRPAQGVHALQIELSRGLYLDETAMTPTPRLPRLRNDLERLTRALAQTDWSSLA